MFTHVPNTLQNNYPAIKMGLVGEVGELVDQIKKILYKPGYERDDEKLLDELGDVGFYIAAVAYMTAEGGPAKSVKIITELEDLAQTAPHPPLAEYTLETQLGTLIRGAADVYGETCMDKVQELVMPMVHAWANICSLLEFDRAPVMYRNREKLGGGKHGWTDHSQEEEQ